MISANCPHCGMNASYQEQHAGAATICLSCRQPFTVPLAARRPRRQPLPQLRSAGWSVAQAKQSVAVLWWLFSAAAALHAVASVIISMAIWDPFSQIQLAALGVVLGLAAAVSFTWWILFLRLIFAGVIQACRAVEVAEEIRRNAGD